MMGFLYDGVDIHEYGGGFLYDGETLPVPDTLLYRDLILVQPMIDVGGVYGADDRPDPGNPPAWCYCCVEGRTQKNSVFSEDWAQDRTPTATGGLRAVTLLRVMAVEWHGDIHTRFWWKGRVWQVDGEPVHLDHGSKLSAHWEFAARLIGDAEQSGAEPPTVPEGSRPWGT